MSCAGQLGDHGIAAFRPLEHDARQPAVPAAPRRDRHELQAVKRRREALGTDRGWQADGRSSPADACNCARPDRRQQVAQPVVVPDLDDARSGAPAGGPGWRGGGPDRLARRSDVTTMPPPLVVAILLPLNENTPISPSVPAGRPRCVAPSASAASSTSATPESRHSGPNAS